MEVHIRLDGRRNLSAGIYRQLRQAIIDGVLRPGEALPPTRQLAARLSVSRNTVGVAYDRLASEGYITAQVGAGTYVSFRAPRAPQRSGNSRHPGVLRPQPHWSSVELPSLLPARQYNFRTGAPDGSLFPYAAWRGLVTRELRSIASRGNGYGDTAGHRGLREAIARHIAISRGIQASPDDLTITTGTQQALDLVARVLLAPGDRVAVENPGYLPAIQLLHSLGAKVVRVPVDEEGLVVDALPKSARLVYVTPSHQYPLGVTMSMRRREALLSWANRTGSAIVEDDYDSEFRFDGRPLDPVHALDTAGRVVYIGTFSKTMLPALRLGFVLVPPALREAVHKAKHVTDWHTNTLIQGALARFIDDGEYARHLRKLNRLYLTRRDRILEILERDFADVLEPLPSIAGMHVAALSKAMSFAELDAVLARALEQGVQLHSLSRYPVDRGDRPGLVLGYGAIATEDIAEGLRRLRAAFDA